MFNETVKVVLVLTFKKNPPILYSKCLLVSKYFYENVFINKYKNEIFCTF